ncbi:MAG: anaerobic ribonucleoside-triphosphate reductase activating protein [Clostridia bacterium]|nr:anaerobic ribonucleoside-triphosphate reductase activating protein [Clostridia bacterium]
MLILGFQKMTLLDYPNKVAATVFTGGCNFRCPFCHNALLVTEIDKSSAYSSDEIISFLKTRKGLLDGVCITGGEPLLQPDIADFMKKIKDLGFLLKLDTNGSFPEKLKEIVGEGLVDYVAMDVKNSAEKYGATIGIDNYDLSAVEQSLDFLLEGKVDFEFRTTVVKQFHTVEDIDKTARRIAGAPRYFLQNFTDSGNLIGEGLEPVSRETLDEMLSAAKKTIPSASLRGV